MKICVNCGKIVFFSIIISFVESCENSIKEVMTYTNFEKQPVVDAKKVEIMYSDSGQIKVILRAKEVRKYADPKEPYMEYPAGIDVSFYNSKHILESNMSANYAIYYENKRLWVAKNNVVAQNFKEQKTLNTEELNWDLRGERFVSDKSVRITSPIEVITGEGFEANQNFDNWRVKKIKNSYVTLKDE